MASKTADSAPSSSTAPNIEAWKAAVTKRIFNVTLDGNEAQQTDFRLTYLYELADELKQEGQGEKEKDL